jgi:hypothetical protein
VFSEFREVNSHYTIAGVGIIVCLLLLVWVPKLHHQMSLLALKCILLPSSLRYNTNTSRYVATITTIQQYIGDKMSHYYKNRVINKMEESKGRDVRTLIQ